ncbi:ODA11 [Symbiodinium natans]|uniref:ODA11 protein n=1 Tax=Symbiodinium natans TaxID=878477 RepID=A0A812UD76_9DINO|nr:ODA11 [Symbiodinium natans]
MVLHFVLTAWTVSIVSVLGQVQSREDALLCAAEPWGRYSASGGLYTASGVQYIYSFGGDTRSHGDERGGVVSTNWRFRLGGNGTKCWERVADSPAAVGYRSTATALNDHVYLFGGGDTSFAATGHFWRYSLLGDSWEEMLPSQVVGPWPSARYKHATVKISETRMLLLGGRRDATVLSDAWLFDLDQMAWSLVGDSILQVYRHGMAYDPLRQVVWIHGGLDGNRQRYGTQLWRWNISTFDSSHLELAELVPTTGPGPSRLASHAAEYIPELDALLFWGGTCSDDAQLYLYDIARSAWCAVYAGNRPDRRDAMIWALDYPRFYVAQGDLICHNFGIYPIVDVHVFDFAAPWAGWQMLYEPRNERGTGAEAYCDGTNRGSCQPQPLLAERGTRISQPAGCESGFMDSISTWANTSTTTTVADEVSSTSSPALSRASANAGRAAVVSAWVLSATAPLSQ